MSEKQDQSTFITNIQTPNLTACNVKFHSRSNLSSVALEPKTYEVQDLNIVQVRSNPNNSK